MTETTKQKVWDYFILIARFLLAWTFIRYGYSKLVDGQFGITDAELSMQLKDLSFFKLSWYLFDQEPFKSFIGTSQIICGLLLLFHRTTLIGAFMFLPIVSTILIIDLTFMSVGLAQAFAWRLGFYIFLDFLILWHYNEKMRVIWDAVWNNVNTKFKIPIWAYLLVPLFAIMLEIMGFIPKILTQLILDPEGTLEGFKMIPNLIREIVKDIEG